MRDRTAPTNRTDLWRLSLRTGVIMGIVALYLALAGIIESFASKEIINHLISLGTIVLAISSISAGTIVHRRVGAERSLAQRLALSALAGAIANGFLALLALLMSTVNLRPVFVNATNPLLSLLTLGQGIPLGIVALLIVGAILGAVATATSRLPILLRKALLNGLAAVALVGILNEFFSVILSSLGLPNVAVRFLFARKSLSLFGGALTFILAAAVTFIWPPLQSRLGLRTKEPPAASRSNAQRTLILLVVALVMLLMPRLIKLYWTDVLDNIGLFILMGLGLNIVVGFAGLLDLGYVAFFALGAYTLALLTSPASFLGTAWSFWAAWPFALIVAAFAGILLGIPVLRMRGDYLAIVTLGFGEIIRVMATSDLLKPYIGGAQGILGIPKPSIFNVELLSSSELYYLIVLSCLLIGFVSWRLSDSRIGRAWMAIREDEDVAEAMGINLVKYKLMAFSIGAAFAGMSGAINATKLGSIYPHSFNLLISINVLSLIIVGGIGSIPGVIVGAFILVGMPEVLREFAEYRLLMYGALLVTMMLVKPEGFWPAEVRRRELHVEGNEGVAAEEEAAVRPADSQPIPLTEEGDA